MFCVLFVVVSLFLNNMLCYFDDLWADSSLVFRLFSNFDRELQSLVGLEAVNVLIFRIADWLAVIIS